MARLTAAAGVLALSVACALGLSACGGSDAKLLPGETAAEITENLDAVKQLAAEEQCVDAEDEALEVSTQIESLQGIDPELKSNLEEGAERLNEVVAECDEEAEEEEPLDTVETTEEEEPEKPTKAEKDAEKLQEKEEKDEEKAEEQEEKEAEAAEPPGPSGSNPGHGGEPPGQEKKEETPSGGIGPGSEAGEED